MTALDMEGNANGEDGAVGTQAGGLAFPGFAFAHQSTPQMLLPKKVAVIKVIADLKSR